MTIRSTLVFVTALVVISGCRPSQQTRRGDQSQAKVASASQTKMMDSLLMVQNKLITVVDTMSGIISQDRKRIAELEREIMKLKSLIEERALNGNQIPPPSLPPPSSAPQAQPDRSVTGAPIQTPPQQAVVTTTPQNDEYTSALRQFNNGKYVDALTAFDDLYRKDGSSSLAPNYLYWKGESLYAMGEYSESIRAFHELLDKFPASIKADDAEFKIAAAYEKMGERTNAKAAYQRLLLSFPDTEYRTRAEARLKKLN